MFFLEQSAHLAKPTTIDAVSGSAPWATTAANRTAAQMPASRQRGRAPMANGKLGLFFRLDHKN